MPDTIFRRNFEYQRERIALLTNAALESYLSVWNRVILEWRSAVNDAVWLTYSANYLFHTEGVRWALDPLSLFSRLSLNNPQDFTEDLSQLDAIVLSHSHADHLDIELLSKLVDLPLIWIVPDFLMQELGSVIGNKMEIIVPTPGNPICIKNLTLTPFPGLHFRDGNGVPELGYLAEFSGKRWAFPGDTRSFPLRGLTDLGKIDGIFAHLWLGKRSALQEIPTLLNDFCRFFTEPAPRRLVITHMHELARDPYDFWDSSHFEQVFSKCQELNPEIQVTLAWMGMSVEL